MHTTDGESASFVHNGDFSGEVQISVPHTRVVHRGSTSHVTTIEVNFADIKALVAEYVRDRRIAALEDADADEVLEL